MEEVLMKLVPIMFAAVIALVGWVGKRLHDKMDDLSDKFDASRHSMEQRVTRVESAIDHVENRLEKIEETLIHGR